MSEQRVSDERLAERLAIPAAYSQWEMDCFLDLNDCRTALAAANAAIRALEAEREPKSVKLLEGVLPHSFTPAPCAHCGNQINGSSSHFSEIPQAWHEKCYAEIDPTAAQAAFDERQARRDEAMTYWKHRLANPDDSDVWDGRAS